MTIMAKEKLNYNINNRMYNHDNFKELTIKNLTITRDLRDCCKGNNKAT